MNDDRFEAAARALFEMPHNTARLGTCRIMARAALNAADENDAARVEVSQTHQEGQ